MLQPTSHLRNSVSRGSGVSARISGVGWRERLRSGISETECDSTRRATHTGEPLGSREFLQQLERQAGRRLQVLARGRPAKRLCQPERTGLLQSLFGVEV
jgi:hypothetical protein